MDFKFRVDGSHDVGLGHLYRTSTLAKEALGRGHKVTVATTNPSFAEEIFPDETTVESLSSVDPEEEFCDSIRNSGRKMIISDSYHLSTIDHRKIYNAADTYAIISDSSEKKLSADYVINGNIYANKLNYDWIGREPKWLLGLEYLVLRQEFQQYLDLEPPFRSPPERAVVIMGGVDKAGRTPRIIKVFSEIEIDVTAIIGPGYENVQEIRDTAKETENVVTATDPSDLSKIMFQSDFAVSALGTTTYELMATGTPIIGIPDNITPLDRSLASRNAAIVLSRYPSEQELRNSIEKMVENDGIRRKLQSIYANLIVGNGPERIVEAIE